MTVPRTLTRPIRSLSTLIGPPELLRNLTLREIRGKYRRSALGQVWSLLNPLAQMAIFTVVFGLVLRQQPEPGDPSGLDVFALWLSAGLLPWAFLSNSVSSGLSALLDNANLIKKVYFPRQVLVAAPILSWAVTFGIEMLVLTVMLLVFGGQPLLWLPLVAVTMALLMAFALGLALALSVANVYFRDTQHLVGIAMQIWFYSTPIVYPIQLVHDRTAENSLIWQLYRLNPMERFVSVFRSLLYDNRFPAFTDVGYCIVVPVVVLALGFAVFRRCEQRLAEEL